MTNSQPSPQEAAQELLNRRMARRHLEAFTTYTKPDYEVNWHHAILFDYLDRFIAGEIKRLMVFAPPRTGKSEIVSRRLPAFILGQNPNAQIIACSYADDLAGRMNRDVQRIIDDPLYQKVFPGTKLYGKNIRATAQGTYLRNSDLFEVVNFRGAYRSAGVGSGITGMGLHYGIIDDPIKDRKQASSLAIRETVWEWYTSTFYTRQEKDAGILITLTRWDEDDLAGRLLDLAASDPKADQWVVISFPAILDTDPGPYDPRQPNEALWPNKQSLEFLEKVKANSLRDWEAMYQQRPRAPEGDFFKRSWFEYVDAVPVDAERVRWWDQAATEGDGDWTVGVLMARSPEGLYYVEDVVRGQWASGERDKEIRSTADQDAEQYGIGRVQQWSGQEPGSGGKDQANAFIRLLDGHWVSTEPESGSKENRADPFRSQAQAGNVKLKRNSKWNKVYLDVLCGFPNGKNDDDVDASSGAFNKLATAPQRPRTRRAA